MDEEKMINNILPLTSAINALIKREWETIDIINSNIVMLNDMANPEVIEILNEMLNDSYIHIGQFEKIIESQLPAAEQIQDGKESAEETLSDEAEDGDVEIEYSAEDEEEEEEEVIEEPDEEFPSDDVPADVADKVEFKQKAVDDENGAK